MGGFRFRLIAPDGEDLGTYETMIPNWEPGDVIPRGSGDSLRVVDVVYFDEDADVRGLLRVEAT